MWVSKFIGEIGLAALSIAYIIDASALAFGFFVSVGAATILAYLLSTKNYEKVNQVTADLFMLCLIFALIVPAILLPLAKPIFRFLQAPDNIQKLAFDYVIPLCAMNLITCCYHCICGVLQAEGRTWTYGGAQMVSMICNMVLFDPLLLYLLKRTVGSSLATELAMLIPASVLISLLFCKKFAAKPTLKMFFQKFAPETWMAVKTGLATFIMNISFVVPTFVMQKYLSIRAKRVGKYETVIAVYNTLFRIYGLSFFVPLAMNASYLPSAAYAFGKKENKRILWLTWHVIWISCVWGFLITFITSVFPDKIALIFSKDDEFIYWSKRMIPKCFWTYSCACVKFIMISFLQSTQQTMKAMILSILTELLGLPIFGSLFHYLAEKESPITLLYAYPVNDICAALCCLATASPTFYKFIKSDNNTEENDQKSDQVDSTKDESNKEDEATPQV
ncbi:MatE family protein [Trichomonas vaginalis G3]|uniref:MatE family protein n=1 Tax=Trichomonas vaginalis (strain ATCC PRA-98 / G3) TaxID=412133 RepID=A2FGE4_TRIV3|nr:multidrug resistance protein YPNP-related family [Trichomonas vaginalis G3]XP_051076589.1 multidrug resistance protein YPNP-related family [Trichomonas vaginalis G3]EAX96008.1 MatE family protein [Trichomonas vaginalis G3]KAI5483328.1 multidrug resistance protein YPNP-related family [Trichomonas vaginalis G3]KAI5537113.1 multidrug resistance protein YPNP-related family [Trichomonas vaginalis G3]|eukprot:XP_001308938.1 MatE family protein [Trichomonas vaginalis G3]